MSPSDQPQMHAMAEVSASLFRQIGLNVETVAMDWGTLLSRRASKKPPAATRTASSHFVTELAGKRLQNAGCH